NYRAVLRRYRSCKGLGTRGQGSGIRDQGSGIRDQGSGIRDQGSGTETSNSKLQTSNSKLRTPNFELQTSNLLNSHAVDFAQAEYAATHLEQAGLVQVDDTVRAGLFVDVE